jgi:hypothetical protein
MKIAITKYEKFALTSHLIGLPSPNPEHGRKRLRAWDELGTADLADKLAFVGAGLGSVELKISDWADKTTPVDVELSEGVADYILAGLGVQVAGIWADVLTRVRDRIEKSRAA